MNLHLWKLRLDNRAASALAREQHLYHRHADEGYLTHAALSAAFGNGQAPSPFVLEHQLTSEPARVAAESVVLAYSATEFDRSVLSPGWAQIVADGASKPVPQVRSGTRLSFITRVSPVVRTRHVPDSTAPLRPRGKSREVDAFLAACGRVDRDTVVDRAAVYRDWLEAQLQRHEGASLEDFSLRSFKRTRLLRKEAPAAGEARKRHVLERPDVVLTGLLRVSEPEAFRAQLARGLGRHRAFGFGMLVIRRAE